MNKQTVYLFLLVVQSLAINTRPTLSVLQVLVPVLLYYRHLLLKLIYTFSLGGDCRILQIVKVH